MPIFIFILGYTTLISYLIVGMKCARFLHETRGSQIYIAYSVCVLTFFSFFDQSVPLLVMRCAGALLLIINLAGIYRLRHEVVFSSYDHSADANLAPCAIGDL
jgi:AGCS family alanine or glycine:cation symporter